VKWTPTWKRRSRPSGKVPSPPFDEVATEGEVETVEDLSGGGHTATLHGATWTAHGRYGGALEFDAEKEASVSIPVDAGLDGHEELRVEAWVRPSGSPYFAQIAMKEREGSGAGYSWTLDQHSSEPVGYFMQSEEGMVAGGEDSLPLHTWTHVAMTDDGGDDRLCVDGVLVDTAPAFPFDSHGPIKIGGNQLFGQLPPKAVASRDQLWSYLEETLAARHHSPTGDLMSVLAAAVAAGELSKEEALANSLFLLDAGIVSSNALIASYRTAWFSGTVRGDLIGREASPRLIRQRCVCNRAISSVKSPQEDRRDAPISLSDRA